MFPDLQPKFAKRFAEVGVEIVNATRAYVEDVRGHRFPAAEHTFKPSGLTFGAAAVAHPSSLPALSSDEALPPHWQTH